MIFVLVQHHVTRKLRVFHLWQTHFASYEELTGSVVRGLFFMNAVHDFDISILSLCLSVCLSVCPFMTDSPVFCVEMAKLIVRILVPSDSSVVLFFLELNVIKFWTTPNI